MAETEQRGGAPAVVRALRVLERIAETGGSVRMSELAGELNIAKSSLHHLLAALTDAGWLERDAVTKEVSLGLRAWEVGQAYETGKTLTQRAQPLMDSIRDQLGETVRLAVLSGTDNVLLAKSEGVHTLVFDQRVGARLPAHATGLGKALLSGLRDSELATIYEGYAFEPFTTNTLASAQAIIDEMRTTRERGWAEDDGEFILGIRCIAYPVRSREGDIVAALSVSVPVARLTEQHQAGTHALLADAAVALAARLGGGTDLI